LIGVVAIWGGGFAAGRILAQQAGPTAGALLRFLAASGLFLILLARKPMVRLTARQWGRVTLLALTGVFLYNLLFLAGLKRVPASRASLIIALNPAFTAMLAAVFLRERFSWTQACGTGLALFGGALVIARGDLGSLLQGALGTGEAMLFACMLSWVSYTLLGRRLLADVSPFVASAYASLIGTGMLALAALADGSWTGAARLRWDGWIAVLYMGGLATVVGFTWFYEGVRKLGPARTAVYLNLAPVFAVVFAYLVLGETLPAGSLAGGLLVVAGVAITNRR
jgi:drug/metabolite transporter (DMT)-like permease